MIGPGGNIKDNQSEGMRMMIDDSMGDFQGDKQ